MCVLSRAASAGSRSGKKRSPVRSSMSRTRATFSSSRLSEVWCMKRREKPHSWMKEYHYNNMSADLRKHDITDFLVICCRDCLHRIDCLHRSRLFQKTIDSSQCFSAHLQTCVVAVDLECNGRFLISLFRNILVVSFPERSSVCIYTEWLRKAFCFIGMESSFLFVGLLYISFIVDC